MKRKIENYGWKLDTNCGCVFNDGDGKFHGSARTKDGIVDIDGMSYRNDAGKRVNVTAFSMCHAGRYYQRNYYEHFSKKGCITVAGRFSREIVHGKGKKK